ncbi:MAG: FemAB family PEP-CTERM system-associated protein [Phycisphaerales bacterium]|nr:FemAB family PEP-CTERM system-associated protein [Phycisphaerales bacterium]
MPGHALQVHTFESRLGADWQKYVHDHPDGTLFHGLAWKRAVERTFGHRSRYLIAYRQGCVSGVLPMFEVRSVVAGRLLVSVPYGTYGGILADDSAVCGAIFEKAKSIGARINVRSIEFRSIKAHIEVPESNHTHVTFRKPLPTDKGRVWEVFPRKARAAARQASKRHELTVEFGDEHLATVWRLYARSMRRLASPNYPFRFFESLAQATGDRHVVQLVRCRGRPVAGLLTFLDRETVMPYFAGLDERVKIYGLNQYLYLESMRWGVERGYRMYDFGRTRVDNIGSFNFKRLCGFEPSILEYQTFVMPGQVAADLSPTSPRWTAARRVWRALPLSITRPLGSWLAKSIPG